MWSTIKIVRIQSSGLNSGQKAILEAVIRKKKHQSCNLQNYQTLRLWFAIDSKKISTWGKQIFYEKVKYKCSWDEKIR